MVEGFYGTPWTLDARSDVVDFMAALGMNAYVYAPKDDPFHRKRWREPYPDDLAAGLLATAERARSQGVRFGYAVSPGLDIDYGSRADREALWSKLEGFVDEGVDWIVLAFDDVPLRPGSGAAQADLVTWLAGRTEAHVSVVPTDYVGCRPSDYLDALCSRLPVDVDVMWTGVTVVSPQITAADAKERRAATHDHPVLIWDNYPVNDAFMAPSLHLGPLVGRDPGLSEVCVGLLANPMSGAHASTIALGTIADYLLDPAGYDPVASWTRVLQDVGGDDVAALTSLARACAGSLLDERVPLHDLIDVWERAGSTAGASLDAIRVELEAAASLPDGLPPVLVDEVRPWAEQASREASAGLAALSALGAASSAPSTDPWSAVMGVMRALVMWSAARAASDRVAFGARFACYPGIVIDKDGDVAIDPDLSLIEDANAIDRLCRLALRSAKASS